MAEQLRERIDALTEDRRKLQTILAAMAEGVVAVDAEQRVLHMNAPAGRILGADPVFATAAAKPLRSVSRIHEVAEALEHAIRTGEGRHREVLLVAFPKDRVLEIQSSPIPGEDAGAPAGAVVVLHDVTELRRLEAVRRDFVANVSHELKTPLTAVRGIVETLQDDRAMPEGTRGRFLKKLDEQSRRLVRIVTDLLSLSRVESGHGDLERVPVDFRSTVQESVRALSSAAEDRKVALTARLPEESITVRGDRPSLRLLVDNLVDNAVKYTPAGGRVDVRLGTTGGWATLEVEDTGIGISEEHRDRLFERFYRVDKARSRELGGTGLGLAIVKHVALAHEGDVTFESVSGEGSTFRVRLPVLPEA
jgi:two-component system phosphate regulon sensor histidine kinase PhoR